MISQVTKTMFGVPGMTGISSIIKKMKKHPLILVAIVVFLMYLGYRPSDVVDTAADLVQDGTDVAADVVHGGVDLAKGLADAAVDTAANVVGAVEDAAVGESVGSRKRSMYSAGKLPNHLGPELGSRKAGMLGGDHGIYKGGSRKALQQHGGLYGSPDLMGTCADGSSFGSGDRHQCLFKNIPASESVRPHPLVTSGELEQHYDGQTGIGPMRSSGFYAAPISTCQI